MSWGTTDLLSTPLRSFPRLGAFLDRSGDCAQYMAADLSHRLTCLERYPSVWTTERGIHMIPFTTICRQFMVLLYWSGGYSISLRHEASQRCPHPEACYHKRWSVRRHPIRRDASTMACSMLELCVGYRQWRRFFNYLNIPRVISACDFIIK